MKILEGAEPFSAAGGPIGVLVLHGFTSCPQSMRPQAEAFAAAGYTVELPLLPGHGTTVEDMATTGFADWSAAADAAYKDLASRCRAVVVAGLSLGGALTLWLAAEHPEIAGIVVVNPFVESDDFAELAVTAKALLETGAEFLPGVGGDIADPDVKELAYASMPNRCIVSLIEAAAANKQRLPDITMPVLILHSTQDHVIPPSSVNLLMEKLGGPKEIVDLERGFHVATIDLDKDVINQRALEFAAQVTAGR